MSKLIEAVSDGVPVAPTELRRLGRALRHRAGDVLYCFDRPGTSDGLTEAIISRLGRGQPAKRPAMLASRLPW